MDPATKASNSTHSHFIQTLEYVLEALQSCSVQKPKAARPRPPVTSNELTKEPALSLINRFQGLGIDEPVDDEDIEMPSLPPASVPPSSAHRTVSYQPDTDDETEASFALQCLFSDLWETQAYLQNLWARCGIGAINPCIPSVITSVAFKKVRLAEKELYDTFPIFRKPGHDAIMCIYLSLCSANGVNLPAFDIEVEPYTYSTSLLAHAAFLHSYTIVAANFLTVSSQPAWARALSLDVRTELHVEEEERQIHEKFVKDFKCLSLLIAELRVSGGMFMGSRDELAFALPCGGDVVGSLLREPLSLSFMAQIYLDINDILGKQQRQLVPLVKTYAGAVGSRLKELRDKAYDTRSWGSMQKTMLSRSTCYVQAYAPDDARITFRESYLHGFMAAHEKVTPLSNKAREILFSSYGVKRDVEADYGLSLHPVMCGLVEYHVKAHLYRSGYLVEKSFGYTPSLVHLYTFFKRRSMLGNRTWPELETCIALNEGSKLLLGNSAEVPRDCARRFSTFSGMDLRFSAGSKDKNAHIRNSKRIQGRTSSLMPQREWLAEPEILCHFILDRKEIPDEDDAHPDNWVLNVDTLLKPFTASELKDRKIEKRRDGYHLNMVQFLDLLKVRLEAEDELVSFDHIAMHFLAQEFAQELAMRIKPDLECYPPIAERPVEDLYHQLASIILNVEADNEDAWEFRRRSRKPNAPPEVFKRTRVFLTACEVMNEFVQKYGKCSVPPVAEVTEPNKCNDNVGSHSGKQGTGGYGGGSETSPDH